MNKISEDCSRRLGILLDDIGGIAPSGMEPLIALLRRQIGELQYEETLLTDVIVLLKEYYQSGEKRTPGQAVERKPNQDELQRINDLLIVLVQLQTQENVRVQCMKVRR